jgi:hypothetical protein
LTQILLGLPLFGVASPNENAHRSVELGLLEKRNEAIARWHTLGPYRPGLGRLFFYTY